MTSAAGTALANLPGAEIGTKSNLQSGDPTVLPLLRAADEVSVKNGPFLGRGEGEPRHLQAITSEMTGSCSRTHQFGTHCATAPLRRSAKKRSLA
jgi:hypothetical protein